MATEATEVAHLHLHTDTDTAILERTMDILKIMVMVADTETHHHLLEEMDTTDSEEDAEVDTETTMVMTTVMTTIEDMIAETEKEEDIVEEQEIIIVTNDLKDTTEDMIEADTLLGIVEAPRGTTGQVVEKVDLHHLPENQRTIPEKDRMDLPVKYQREMEAEKRHTEEVGTRDHLPDHQ